MDSAVSSTSTSYPSELDTLVCSVCGKSAKGTHHGAVSCRGCSAFFRRAASNKTWKCKKGNRKCDVSFLNDPPCKKCRLDKCYSVGMSAKNFQFDRDGMVGDSRALSLKNHASTSSKIPRTIEIYLGRPHILLQCDPNLAYTKKVYLDLNNLIRRASEILIETDARGLSGGNLESLTNGLSKMRMSKASNGRKTVARNVSYFGQKEILTMWEYDFLRTARWLSYFEEFRKLPQVLKLQLLKSIWHVWGYLDKLELTAEKRSEKECTDREMMINNETKLDMKLLKFDVSWCTKYENDQLSSILMGGEKRYTLEIMDMLVEMNPTKIEVNFMFIQTCFSYAARCHQGEIINSLEKIQEIVTNELHEYYVHELKISNYAARISKLLKMDRLMQKYLLEKRRKVELARIFDIFSLEYSHPEMFRDTGY